MIALLSSIKSISYSAANSLITLLILLWVKIISSSETLKLFLSLKDEATSGQRVKTIGLIPLYFKIVII